MVVRDGRGLKERPPNSKKMSRRQKKVSDLDFSVDSLEGDHPARQEKETSTYLARKDEDYSHYGKFVYSIFGSVQRVNFIVVYWPFVRTCVLSSNPVVDMR